MHSPRSSRAHAPSRLRTLSLVLLAAFALIHPLHAQSTPPCTAANLDTTFRFGNYPPSTYIVSVLSTNISDHACHLISHNPPTFYANREPAPQLISICLDCDQPHPLGMPSAPPSVTLRPGESAHQSIRWTTSPSTSSRPCHTVNILNVPTSEDDKLPTQLVSPSLLPPICSEVDAESYALGPIFGDDDSLPAHSTSAPALRISSYRVTYLPGESFTLHAESGTPSTNSSANGTFSARGSTRCPMFLLRQRSANGATRLEEFISPQIRCTRDRNSDPTQPYITTSFDAVPPIQPTGDATFQLYQLSGPTTAPRIGLAQSNAITLHISATGTPTQASTETSPRNSTPAPAADLTAYTGWQTAFTVTDTSFGKRTALLDQTTHLEWLRLSETRNKSQDSLSHAMSPRKPFAGWRFATGEEVVTFFRHFTGAPSGRTNDPSIESELQRLMGGPLATTHSNPGDWTRGVSNGRIAGYYSPTDLRPAGAPRFQYHYAVIREETSNGQTNVTVNPNQVGWIDGDTTSPDTGTWLVREH